MQRRMTEDELARFYHEIGRAIWNMQYVEKALGYFIVITGKDLEPNSLTPSEAEKILSSIQKKTLGALVNEIAKKKLLPPALVIKVEKFNSERRWLVHKSLIESGEDLYNEDGRNTVFRRIELFTNEALLLQKLIHAETNKYFSSIGVDITPFNKEAEKTLTRLRGTVA
ncbi:hypothetical protein BS048_RS22635 [Vibrio parahaemolyticus]|uniref:hypothetical protein n=1 Tax=Vibrio parahaemolyticus TaxID=670 RepID=UPI001E4ED2F4|nr:hypothetical protein [Vibrio parahaemolyticus]EJG1899470.1 hypothetical protein [Vibrio parahaemolyticus]